MTDPIKSLSSGEIERKILREEVTKQGQSKRIENKEAKSWLWGVKGVGNKTHFPHLITEYNIQKHLKVAIKTFKSQKYF